MDSFIFTINAILPIVLLVALGYILRKYNIISENFIKDCHKFNFRYGFFAMVFCNMYSIESFSSQYRNLMLFSVISILCLVASGFIIGGLFIKDNRQKGVMAQAAFRSNFAIIGIPLAQNLFGEEGARCAAVLIATTIPLFNIFAVISLTVFLKNDDVEIERPSFGEQAKSIAIKLLKNPMIQGVLAGAVCLLIRPHTNGWTLKNGDIRFVYKTLDTLSKMCTPLALVMLGGQFKFSAVRKLLGKIIFGVTYKILIGPVLGLLAAWYFFPEFKGPEYASLIALFGTPVAVASAIMADQMQNDSELAGQILVWSTLFSVLTLSAFIFFFKTIGIF